MLTTHVLDTARGVPAAGVNIAVYELDGETPRLLARGVTNADGRLPAPLLATPLEPGWYELVFDAGEYFARANVPAFYGAIAVRFRIERATSTYHVPLLLAPWGYSTYRGS